MNNALLRLAALVVVGIVGGMVVYAQEFGQEEEDRSWEWAERSFVIAKSTTDYDEALDAAQEIASTLDIRLDLRGLAFDPEIGLSWPAMECESGGWEHPCYVARGRFDNGVYVSIEHSSAYEGFAAGYYIVVVASGADDANELIEASLKKARAEYPDAYVKRTKVYMGCMH